MAHPFPTQPTKQVESDTIKIGEPGDDQAASYIEATSLGERLIPLLMLIGEVCMGYAILLFLGITMHFLGLDDALVPFWGLLLIVCSFYAVAKFFQQRSQLWFRNIVEPFSWLFLCMISSLFFVWFNNYAQTSSLFSLDWLIALINTFKPVPMTVQQASLGLVHVNLTPTFQICVLPFLTATCGWRGYRLANKHFISNDIDSRFKWGSGLIAFVIILFIFQFRSGATHVSPLYPALLGAGFCICVLTARSLAQASYMRRFHGARLWGSAARQERIIWVVMSILSLMAILFVVLFGHATTVTPIKPDRQKFKPGGSSPDYKHATTHYVSTPFPLWPTIIVALLIIGVIAFLFWRRYQKLRFSSKRAKRAKASEEISDELHETVFNWSLFFAQVRAALLALLTWLNPFRRRASRDKQAHTTDDIVLAEPAVRSIREVYRARLKRAASRGHARETDETPYEFRLRLHKREAAAGAELEAITEAYVLARYGGNRPGKDEVARVKALWGELKQKWG